MSAQTNRQFITRYLEAINGKPKPPELVARFVEDQALKEHIALFEAAFPSYELRSDDMVAEGDKVAVRTTFRGVHRGEFYGIPATGREVVCSVMLIYRVAGDKIVEHHMNADNLSVLQQLGAIPAPQSVTA
jgi:predicted ester cyclase